MNSRRSVEPALDKAALNSLLIETVRDCAIFAIDAHGTVRTWNPGAEQFTGYTADVIIGQHFSVFYPPEDVAAGKPEQDLAVAERDNRFVDEGWRVTKDGTRFWADVDMTALRTSDGVLLGFATITRDTTAKKRAQQALRDSEERFRLLVMSVKDYGIFMLDEHGCIASWNEGAQRIKGYSADEIIGQHFSVFYPASDVSAGKPAMELRGAIKDGRYEDEGWRLRKDGTRFWANVIITALFGSDGTLIGFAKVTRDLTERRAAEERALADALRVAEIEAANRAKSEFLTALSHELRTPLNAIGGYAELMAMGIRGPITMDQAQDLERIRASQQHLLGIINDLLNFSRIEAGRLNYTLTSFPLDDVVDLVVMMMGPQTTSRGLLLETIPTSEEITAYADRARVEQILINLLSNAVKFTNVGDRITISYEADETRALVHVRDTGIGIEEDQLTRIFEPFVQLGRSLTTVQEGTGIGLAISRDLARAMQGDLTVESAVGIGTTFTLSLPVRPPE